MEGLTIESFNEILLGALKAGVKKSELLAKELEMAYGLKVQAMEDVIYCLTYNEPYRVALDKVHTIDANCDRLAQMLEAAQQEENKEYRDRYGEIDDFPEDDTEENFEGEKGE